MEWEEVVVEWVNCLGIHKAIASVGDLADGGFFKEALRLLNERKSKSTKPDEIFDDVKAAIKGHYTPEDWIDFSLAREGDGTELVKVVSVVIVICSFQGHEKLFLERPATSLPSNAQVDIKRYLMTVLENKKVVTDEILRGKGKGASAKPVLNFQRGTPATRSLPHYRKVQRRIPESPHIYVSSPQTPRQQPSRECEVSDTEKRQAQLIENIHSELKAKKATIADLESSNSDLQSKLDLYEDKLKSEREKAVVLKERINELEKSREELTNENQQKSNALQEAENKAVELQTLVSKTQSLLKKSDLENERVVSENEEGKHKLICAEERASSLQEKLQSFILENESLREKMEEHDKVLEKLSREKEDMEERVGELLSLQESYNARLQDSKSALIKAEEDFVRELDSRSKDLEVEHSRVLALEKDVEEVTVQKEKVVGELSGLREEFSVLTSQFEDSESALIKAKEELEARSKDLEVEKSRVLALEKDVAAVTEQKEKVAGELSGLKEEFSALTAELAGSKSALLKAEEDFAKELEARSRALEIEQSRILELEKDIAEITVQKEKVAGELSGLKGEFSVLTSQFEDSKSALIKAKEEFAEELDARSKELEVEQSRVSALEKDVAAVSHQKDIFMGELNGLKETFSALTAELADSKSFLFKVEKDLDVEQSRVLALEKIAAEITVQKEKVLIELSGLREEFSVLTSQFEDSKSALIKAEEELEARSRDLEVEHSRVSDLENNIVEVTDQKEKFVRELFELKEEYAGLTSQFEDSQSALVKAEEELNARSKDLEVKHSRVLDLEKDVAEVKVKKDKVVGELSVLREEYSVLTAQLTDSKSALLKAEEDFAKELEARSKDLEVEHSRVLALQKDVEDITVQKEKVVGELSGLKGEFSALTAELAGSKSALLKAEEDFAKELEARSKELEVEKSQVLTLQKDVDEVTHQNQIFMGELNGLKEDMEVEHSRVLDLEKDVAEVTVQKEKLMGELNGLKEGFSAVTAELAGSKSALCKAEEDFAKELDARSKDLEVEKSRVLALEKDVADVTVQKEKFVGELSELKEEFTVLTSQFEDSQSALIKTRADLEVEHSRVLALEKDVAEVTVEREILMGELTGLKEKFSAVTDENAGSKSALKKAEEDFAKELDARSKDLEVEHSRVLALEKDIAEVTVQKENLRGELFELKEKYSVLSAELQDSKTALVKAEEKSDARSKELEVEHSRVLDLEKDVAEVTVQKEKFVGELSGLREEFSVLNYKFEDAKAALINAEEELGARSKDLEVEHSRVLALEKDVEEVTIQKENLMGELFELKEKYSVLTADLAESKSSLLKAEEDFAKELNARSKDLEVEHSRVLDLENNIAEVTEQKEKLVAELFEVKEEYSVLTSELEDSKSALLKAEGDFAKELDARSKDLEVEQSRVLALEQDVAEVTVEKEKVVGELSELREELSVLTSQFEDSQTALLKAEEVFAKELDARSKDLELKHSRVLSLEKDVEEVTHQKEILIGELNELTEKVSTLTTELSGSKSALLKAEEMFDARSKELEAEHSRVLVLENNIAEVTVQKEKFVGELCVLREEYSVLTAELADSKSALLKAEEDSAKELDAKSKDLEVEQSRVLSLEKDVAEVTVQKEKLMGELTRLKEESAESNEKCSRIEADLKKKYKKKFEDLKTQMAQITGNEIEKMRVQLEEKSKELADLKESTQSQSKVADDLEDLKRQRGLLKHSNTELNNSIFVLKESLKKKTDECDSLKQNYDKISFELQMLRSSQSTFLEPDCSIIKGFSAAGSMTSLNSNIGHDFDRRGSCVSLASVKSNGSTSSRKFVPQGSGSLFTCEDEEDGFQFSAKNLSDLKSVKGSMQDFKDDDDPKDRINEIQRRNTLLPFHMRSCYPSEDFGNDNNCVDENRLRVSTIGTEVGTRGLQRQTGTLSLSKLKGQMDETTSSNGSYQPAKRTPFSPTSSHINGGLANIGRAQTSLGFSPMKPKQKSDSALTPRKKKPGFPFRVPFPRD